LQHEAKPNTSAKNRFKVALPQNEFTDAFPASQWVIVKYDATYRDIVMTF